MLNNNIGLSGARILLVVSYSLQWESEGGKTQLVLSANKSSDVLY